MNEATKQFFIKLYLEQANYEDYVDWALTCLEEGFDSKSLRLLAGIDKTHSIKADFEELLRQALQELDWKWLDKKESLFSYAKDIANQILSDEIDFVEAVEKIYEVYVQIGFPTELIVWDLLYDGHSDEWYESYLLLPFISKFNREKWLEAVMREAKDLAERDFS